MRRERRSGRRARRSSARPRGTPRAATQARTSRFARSPRHRLRGVAFPRGASGRAASPRRSARLPPLSRTVPQAGCHGLDGDRAGEDAAPAQARRDSPHRTARSVRPRDLAGIDGRAFPSRRVLFGGGGLVPLRETVRGARPAARPRRHGSERVLRARNGEARRRRIELLERCRRSLRLRHRRPHAGPLCHRPLRLLRPARRGGHPDHRVAERHATRRLRLPRRSRSAA